MSSNTQFFRLEPLSSDAGMSDGLKAEVRDALWFLARQWQLSEFCGHDAGSPAQATYMAETALLTGYAPTTSPPARPRTPRPTPADRQPRTPDPV